MRTASWEYMILIEWEPHTRDFSHELGDQTSQRI